MSDEAHYTEPFQGKDDQWYFDLVAANGEIVEQSEGYESHAGALEGIEAAKRAADAAD